MCKVFNSRLKLVNPLYSKAIANALWKISFVHLSWMNSIHCQPHFHEYKGVRTPIVVAIFKHKFAEQGQTGFYFELSFHVFMMCYTFCISHGILLDVSKTSFRSRTIVTCKQYYTDTYITCCSASLPNNKVCLISEG